ncbi:MAG: cell envelope integrity protein TolA, partial [Gammaproteobacteria bacterium]|nr:cell envelope integrity protein TolA [Gammaproteobacteria bacterium]
LKLEEQQKEKQKELARKKLEKQQEALLAKLKKEQEQKLATDLLSEEENLEQSRRQLSIKQREIEKFIGLQQAKVSRNWNSRENFIGRSLVAKLEINLTRDGKVVSARIIKSSGDEALDISAKNAILKASPLPVPEDDELFKTFVNYNFTFRPDELS